MWRHKWTTRYKFDYSFALLHRSMRTSRDNIPLLLRPNSFTCHKTTPWESDPDRPDSREPPIRRRQFQDKIRIRVSVCTTNQMVSWNDRERLPWNRPGMGNYFRPWATMELYLRLAGQTSVRMANLELKIWPSRPRCGLRAVCCPLLKWTVYVVRNLNMLSFKTTGFCGIFVPKVMIKHNIIHI